MEMQEKIVNRYTEKPVKTKNGFVMLALILVLFFGSIAAMVCGPVFLSSTNMGAPLWALPLPERWCSSLTCSSCRG